MHYSGTYTVSTSSYDQFHNTKYTVMNELSIFGVVLTRGFVALGKFGILFGIKIGL